MTISRLIGWGVITAMATTGNKRVREIAKEIAQAGESVEDQDGVLSVLSELRRQGLKRSTYNLASPYGVSKRFAEAEREHRS
jgi:hypothetical protein